MGLRHTRLPPRIAGVGLGGKSERSVEEGERRTHTHLDDGNILDDALRLLNAATPNLPAALGGRCMVYVIMYRRPCGMVEDERVIVISILATSHHHSSHPGHITAVKCSRKGVISHSHLSVVKLRS